MRSAFLLLLLALASGAACSEQAGVGGPPFCHGADCPDFKLIEETDNYQRRCYERSTWATSCVHDGE